MKEEFETEAYNRLQSCQELMTATAQMWRATPSLDLRIAIVAELHRAVEQLASSLATLRSVDDDDARSVEQAERVALEAERQRKLASRTEQMKRVIEFCKQNDIEHTGTHWANGALYFGGRPV